MSGTRANSPSIAANVARQDEILMAVKKLNHGRSFASDRAMVEMSKTMDLNAIAEKTGRTPESILKTARRLGVLIKGQKAKGK
jgi:hypothetical protein